MKKRQSIILVLSIVALFIFSATLIRHEYVQKSQATIDYLSEHSIYEDIYFSFNNDPLQKIKLYKNADWEFYHAYIPANPNTNLNIYFSHCKTVCFNGIELSNGDSIPITDFSTPCLIQAINWENNSISEDYVQFYFSDTLPTIYIATESGTMNYIDSELYEKESASYAVYIAGGSLNCTGVCSISGRGNSSWSRAQKPYNINLATATSILGMNSTSAWALQSNYDDNIPQLKNKLVFELAEQLSLPFTPQGEFVHLYLNGQYNGLYLLTQRIKVNDGTVKLSDLEIANQQINSIAAYPDSCETITDEGYKERGVLYSNNPSDISGGYLLEFDSRYETEISYFTTEHQNVVIKSPRAASKEQVAYIADYVREAENAIFTPGGINSITGKSYSDYLDIDSWSKIYNLQNFFVQWDVEYSSFYLYKQQNDPLLYAGPIWDFDLSCGRMYMGNYPKLSQQLLWLEDTQSIWLQQMSKQDNFLKYTKQQYLTEVSPAIVQLLTNDYADIIAPLKSAIELDSIRWDKGNISFEEETTDLYNWLSMRHNFLCDYYQNSSDYCSVTFEFAWGAVPYYVKKNTPLEFLPYREYGEREKNASSFGFEKIIGWCDENSNEVYAENIITQNMIYYPIYQYSEE